MRGDPADRPKAVVIRTRRKPEGHKELIAALALAAYLVQPGDTLSGIAASHGVSLAAVEGANTKIADFNLIYAGQTVEIPEGSSAAQASYATHSSTAQVSSQSATVHQTATSHTSSSRTTSTATTASTATRSSSSGSTSGYSSSSLSDIPGVPQSLAACVAYRESTNLQNPAARGNAYGIIPASGYNVYGTSLAHQKQVFAELYQQYGGSPWAADGCPGT
jgi:murein DD-endopeptidase MepM/ murein hydrolase activator NlpD